MNGLIYASMAVSAAAALAAFFRIGKCRPQKEGKFAVRETSMTIFMGVMLLAIAFFVGYMKLSDAAVAGTDEKSYYFTAGLTLLCGLLGSFTILFGALRRVVVYENRVAAYSPFGVRKEIPWNQIVRVDKGIMSKSLRLTAADGRAISVSGKPEDYERFTAFAQKHITRATGELLLSQTESRLRGGKHL